MNPEKEAMEILMLFGKGGVVADSGGKDSSVLKEIAWKCHEKYGFQYRIEHNHTTLDAPETVYFVRAEREREREGSTIQSVIPELRLKSCATNRVCCQRGLHGFVVLN